MKKQLLYLLLGIVATSFTACSNDSYTSRLNELIIEDMTFTSDQSTKTLSFRHEDLSSYECKSSEEWCVAEFDVANSKLTVSVKANETYDPRTATITLADKINGTLRAFTVTQEQTNSIIFDQSSYDVPMEGGNIAVNMKSNVKYEVTIPSDCDWISLAPEAAKSRGLEESTFTLVVKENTSYKERTALITVANKSTGVSGKITVRQPFNPVLNADNKAFEVAMEGGNVTINMESNVNYDVVIPEDCNWVTRAKASDTKATTTSAVTLNVAENKSYKERDAVVTIKNDQAGVSVPISIHQPFNAVFKADKTAFNVAMDGETVTINMESNITYNVTVPSDCDWITLPTSADNSRATRATSTSVIVLRVNENTSYKNRDAVITIGNEEAQKAGAIKEPIKIYINQSFTTTLKVDKAELEAPMEGNTVSVNVESNVPYKVNIPCDWITLASGSKTRASKTSVVTFRVDANTSGQDRIATITIKNTQGDEEVSVTISQKFTVVFTVDESPLVIDELGGTRGITVAANVDVVVLPQVDWLTVGEKKAGGKGYWTQEINVSALKNKVAQREGTVKFLHAPTNKAFNVKITQNRLLYITEQEISLTEGDEPKPITLNNPNAMEVSWSSSDTAVATVNGVGNVTAGQAGTAEITVTSADKKYSDKVRVTVNKKAVEN